MENAPKWHCEHAHDDRPWCLCWKSGIRHSGTNLRGRFINLLVMGRETITKWNMGRIKMNQAATMIQTVLWKYGNGFACCHSRNEEDDFPAQSLDVSNRANLKWWHQCSGGKRTGKSSANGRIYVSVKWNMIWLFRQGIKNMPLGSVEQTIDLWTEEKFWEVDRKSESQWSTFQEKYHCLFSPNARPRKFHFSWQTFLTRLGARSHDQRNYGCGHCPQISPRCFGDTSAKSE